MRRLKIHHLTRYQYADEVTFLPHQLLLRPREGHDIRIEFSQLKMTPKATIKWHRDSYDNSVAIVTFEESGTVLDVLSEVIIQHYEEMPLDFIVADNAVHYPFTYDPIERVALSPYTLSVYPDDIPVLENWLKQFWQAGQQIETYALLDQLNRSIPKQFKYLVREDPGVQSPAETLTANQGSCRDFATLFIEASRYLGLAARFISGYSYGPSSADSGASTHAWSEVYLPGAGWIGFDSTSGEVTGTAHIPVAVHRHPEAVPPVSGSFHSEQKVTSTLTVDVQVTDVTANMVGKAGQS